MNTFLEPRWSDAYDLSRVLLAPYGTLDGFERELSDKYRTADMPTCGTLVPLQHLNPEKRDISVASGGGSALVANQLARDILKPLTPISVFLKAEATVLENAIGNLVFNRTLTPSLPVWMTENGSVASTPSPTISSITAVPSRCVQVFNVSRSLLVQMRIGNGVESYVKSLFLSALASVIDQAAFAGTGTAGQPAGLLTFSAASPGTANPASLASSFSGVSGGVTRAQLLGLENSVRNLNVGGQFSWIMSPNTKLALKETQAISGVYPSYLVSDDDRIGNDPVLTTTHIPDNTIIGGVFSTAIAILWRGSVDIIVDHISRADYDEIVISLSSLVSIVFPRLTAFAIATP